MTSGACIWWHFTSTTLVTIWKRPENIPRSQEGKDNGKRPFFISSCVQDLKFRKYVSLWSHNKRKHKEIQKESDDQNQIHTEEEDLHVENEDKVAMPSTPKSGCHRSEADLAECPSCEFRGFDAALRKHFSRQHQKKENKSFHAAKRERAANRDPSLFPFTCKICGMKFRNRHSLYSHKKKKRSRRR